jgi:beta-phosphoglucomutase-like phosphatase (HAD superfamily)
MTQALLFDLDGTLMDSCDAWWATMSARLVLVLSMSQKAYHRDHPLK